MRYMTLWILVLFITCPLPAQSIERYTGPIIDMHLHAYNAENYSGGGEHPSGVNSPGTAREHFNQTLAVMEEYRVKKGMFSGSLETIESYPGDDDRVVAGYQDEIVTGDGGNGLIPVPRFEELVQNGSIEVFGEVTAVYKGMTLNDPAYKPYLEICEEYGIPVAYHTGGGPPMTPYNGAPDFRIAKGDPLLIEDVLVKYPELKVYLMHGGEMFFEHAVRMMALYRQLYVDLGVLLWVEPIVQDYAVRLLKSANNAGVLDRVMFGSDQMIWPGAIEKSINFLNSMEFLTLEEKADIFYHNAATFLELSEEEIAAHHD